MPELPEVETIVRDLEPRLTGRILRSPRLFKPDVLRRVSPRRLLATLARNRIEQVTRRAKHVVLRFKSGHRMVVQPGMTGNLLVYDRPLTAPERRYVVFLSKLDGKATFVYRDVRRLGRVWLLDEAGWRSYTARIGPEPLAPEFDAVAFAARFRGTRQAVKKALMDQQRLAGVGNIYANEALFRAGIDPSRPANRLGPVALANLHREVRAVLGEAIAAQGTTLRDYRTGTGRRGGFQFALHVYGRGGQPCPRCGTILQTTHLIDGRATTFCWRCQRGP
ncbi:MAG: bifunctional DNA-formamidopyrimidine glycosylase/DNA-(apurinic or apyrimidinic site) lyase [Gemmatimonadetes bacterium]|nr:bifunctional DNA-formamidopyrimidine glycosylase/DNA-(apurinic or apyrimidinic site) lyase [Gemmatimonadota bacterium]